MSASPPTLTVVLPVHDAGALLAPCIDHLLPELEADDSRVVVVDDGSTDDAVARLRARAHPRVEALRLERSLGPYGARNAGWRHADGDLIAFLDVRCRVRPGWLAALRRAIAAPGVAIAGAGYHVLDGDSAAANLMHRQQPFLAHVSLTDDLPFLPGGNLVMTRETLAAVDGFDATLHSGGDLVLCWQVQVDGLGAVVDAPGALVDWVPREGAGDFVRQRRKYGAARPGILARFTDHGITVPRPSRAPLVGRVRAALRTRETTLPPRLALLEHAAEYAYHRAYRTAWKDLG